MKTPEIETVRMIRRMTNEDMVTKLGAPEGSKFLGCNVSDDKWVFIFDVPKLANETEQQALARAREVWRP